MMELRERYKQYRDGFASGSADRRLGHTSRYASTSFVTDPEGVRWYSQGYRDGNLGLQPRFSEL